MTRGNINSRSSRGTKQKKYSKTAMSAHVINVCRPQKALQKIHSGEMKLIKYCVLQADLCSIQKKIMMVQIVRKLKRLR